MVVLVVCYWLFRIWMQFVLIMLKEQTRRKEKERRLWTVTLSFSKSSVGNKPAQMVARLGALT